MAAGSVRLFTALWPPAPVRDALARLAAAWQWPASAARVDPARYHITLQFLGLVPVADVPRLQEQLEVPFEPATLPLDSARQAVWPGGIAVLEIDAPAPLRALHARLGEALTKRGTRIEDRAWRPHVTFARKAWQARPAASTVLPEWPVDDGYALVRSAPGAGYETIARFGAAR
jgi:2'-5' RNA ligase